MNYLTKENKPKRITARMRAGYMKAKRDWLSANDAYNKQTFGIGALEYKWIQLACAALVGVHTGEVPLVRDMNKWFKDDPNLYDAEGRLLSYLGQPIPF